MSTHNATGRWTLTISAPLSGKVNVRFASESAARAYQAELEESATLNEYDDEEAVCGSGADRTTYTVWFDPAANPSVNIPSIPSGSSFRSAIDSPDAYDPDDY